MKADKMTHPKIERHGEQWRYKKRIPGDVLPHFSGSKFLTFTTKTSDQRAARAECVRWLADHEAQFQMLRQMPAGGSSVPVRSGLSLLEVGAVLADEVARFKAEKLAADELAGEQGLMGLGVMSPEFRLSLIGVDAESARLAVQGFPEERAPFEALALRRLAGVGVPLDASSDAARSAAMAFARACLEVAEVVKLRTAGGLDSTPNPLPRPALVVAPVADACPLLSGVLAAFLGRHDPKQPIMKKYGAVLPMFVEVVGDIPVSQLRQKAVSDFFDMIQKLPPRWSDKRRQSGKTVQELAAMDWPECMAEKTFDDTYRMAVQAFFKFARLTYGDQGWPERLTTEGIKYRGDEEEGKQAVREEGRSRGRVHAPTDITGPGRRARPPPTAPVGRARAGAQCARR